MRWFTRSWWRYLFDDSTGWRNVVCRAMGHPNGPWFYSTGGSEPDGRCQDCDEVIG